MKSLNPKQSRFISIPIATIAMLWAVASTDLSQAGQADASGDDERSHAVRETSGTPRYSDRRIRLLNETMSMPDADAALLDEIERLSVQQRRFEHRYGPESVAARSVRLRLRDLHDRVSTGMQYAARDKLGPKTEDDH